MMHENSKTELIDEQLEDVVGGAIRSGTAHGQPAADGNTISPEGIWIDLGFPIAADDMAAGEGDADQPIVTGRLYNGGS